MTEFNKSLEYLSKDIEEDSKILGDLPSGVAQIQKKLNEADSNAVDIPKKVRNLEDTLDKLLESISYR